MTKLGVKINHSTVHQISINRQYYGIELSNARRHEALKELNYEKVHRANLVQMLYVRIVRMVL